MKRLTYLVLLIFLSCTNNNSDSTDPLIGTWTYYKVFTNGVEGTVTDCARRDFIEVLESGTFTSESYDEGSGTCQLFDASNGSWENLGSGSYRFTANSESNTINITFDANTFYIIEVDGNTTYKDVYIMN